MAEADGRGVHALFMTLNRQRSTGSRSLRLGGGLCLSAVCHPLLSYRIQGITAAGTPETLILKFG
jgi:hypothetical protein